MDDGDEGVNGNSDMDDGDDDENYYSAKVNEGNEPFNDDKGHDNKVGENIKNEDNICVFD